MEMQLCFGKADILLPDFIGDADACGKWAVIACDQFTGEPAYWHKVEQTVADFGDDGRLSQDGLASLSQCIDLCTAHTVGRSCAPRFGRRDRSGAV